MDNSAEPSVPTIVQPAAGSIAWGVLLIGITNLITVPYSSKLSDELQIDLVWVLWIVLLTGILGVGLLTAGVLRLAQHADRAAGVRYSAASINATKERFI